MKFHYWKQNKNGEIRHLNNIPKTGDYISEVNKRIDTNETQHIFTAFKSGNDISFKTVMHSFYCGYDRQIKHENILKKLFAEMKG